ncbi:Uncharacterised protein [Burkholderia pseudomallei]|nr:Uncharacterised protein [Burkholderia pseudomallei]
MAVAAIRHDKAVALLGQAVRPIYRADDRGNPDHEGSCVLLQLNGEKYMVTASHVMEAGKIEDSELYVGGENQFVKVTGEYLRTPAPAGILNDPYDFAVWRLSDADVADLGDVVYVGSDNISRGQTSSDGHVYSIIGYPNTKNRSVDRNLRLASSRRWNYFSVPRDGTKAANVMGVSGSEHIFIGYDKHSKDSTGKTVNSVGLRGVSGGAVIDLGRLTDPQALAPDAEFTPRLVAVFIEYHRSHRVTASTKLGLILEVLEKRGHI